MAVVYEHLRNDTNEVFYVGIGNEEKRAFVKCKRNPYWKHIVNKVGYSVNIIHKDIDWEEAKKIEILLIEKYGRKDLGLGNLVNMTDGGQGSLGLKISEETREKMSKAQKGENNPNFGKTLSEEHRQKISEGKKGSIVSEETRHKIGKKHKGKILTEETREKMSKAQKGKTYSEETREKMREGGKCRKGVKGYYFNKANKKWIAKILVGVKHIYLGSFDTPEEASEAYQKARLIYFV
jgi:hypothetical protein